MASVSAIPTIMIVIPMDFIFKERMIPKIMQKVGRMKPYFNPLSPDKYFCQVYLKWSDWERLKVFKSFKASIIKNKANNIGVKKMPSWTKLKRLQTKRKDKNRQANMRLR